MVIVMEVKCVFFWFPIFPLQRSVFGVTIILPHWVHRYDNGRFVATEGLTLGGSPSVLFGNRVELPLQ